MTSEEKNQIIEDLAHRIEGAKHFYLTDTSELNAEDTVMLRRKCFEKDIKLIVVKNTLLKKALERSNGKYDEFFGILKNSTSIMFSEVGNLPAKLIKELRKGLPKPVLKAAFVEESIYVGDDQLDALATLKSKEELIGDIILILQSPMQNVLGSLQSGGNTMAGILKTLSEKE